MITILCFVFMFLLGAVLAVIPLVQFQSRGVGSKSDWALFAIAIILFGIACIGFYSGWMAISGGG